MFVVNEDNSIYATRGDIVFFSVTAEDKGKAYKFQAGDLIRMKVFGKKAADNVVLQKDFEVPEETEAVEVFLTSEDTKIGQTISKPVDYWYEVELDPLGNPQTIIGYDEDGPKVFKLFPEGADLTVIPIEPEDIPVVDDHLDLSSRRPVENQAVAKAVASLRGDFEKTEDTITKKSNTAAAVAQNAQNAVAVERARIDNLVSGSTADGAEVTDIRVDINGSTHKSAGDAVRAQVKRFWLKADIITTSDVPITFDTENETVTFNGICRLVGGDRIEHDCGYSTVSYAGVEASAVYVVFNKLTSVAECVEEATFDVVNHIFMFGFFKQKELLLSGSVTFHQKYRVDDAICPIYVEEGIGLSQAKMMTQKGITEALADVAAGKSYDMIEKLSFVSGDAHNGRERPFVGDTCYGGIRYTSLFKSFAFDDTAYKLLVCYYNEESYTSFEKYEAWHTESPFTEINRAYKYYALELRTVDGSNVDTSTIDTTLVQGFQTQDRKDTKGANEVYVSASGDDSNDGSVNSPFATIQKAIDNGYRNICVMPGVYREAVLASNINGLHIYAYNGDDYAEAPRSKPTFTNGTFVPVADATKANGVYSFALDDVPAAYRSVFVDKTVAPETSSSRPSYGAGLWANHTNKYADLKLKPVLTREEMLAQQDTFFFDGSIVYANTPGADVSGFTVVGDTKTMFSFRNCNGLKLSGIKIAHALHNNFLVYKSSDVTVNDCEFAYTLYSDNACSDYSDVEYNNCLSYKARNDGFNTHYYGISKLNNCRGIYNYDDGESSHEYCEVIVNGGEYAYNVKGGHSPVNGCKFTCNNSYTHHNNYGLYMIADEEFDLSDSKVLINGCVSIENNIADVKVENYDVVAMNTHYVTIQVPSGNFTDTTRKE